MSDASLSESTVEAAALAWLEGCGWAVANGPDVAPDTRNAARGDYSQVVLEQRLRDSLARLNPDLPVGTLNDAFRKLTRPEGTTLATHNRAFHRLLVDGVTVECHEADGAIRGAQARVLDFDDPANNDWLSVNQFTVVENKHERRPDIVLFVNGLPLGVIELKNPADEEATIWTAWQQIQTYKAELPTLFSMNAALIVSDRCGGSHRHPHGWAGMVQALAHDLGRNAGRCASPPTPGAARRRLQTRAIPFFDPGFQRLRG